MRHLPIKPEDILEKDWQKTVVDLATQLGWGNTYHVHDSRRTHTGWPDLVLVRERIIYTELKREKTQPTPDQTRWLDRLAAAGAEVYLARPSDLDEIARILSHRWEPAARGPKPNPTGLWTPRDGYWTPRSLWIPHRGRHDTTIHEQQTLEAHYGT